MNIDRLRKRAKRLLDAVPSTDNAEVRTSAEAVATAHTELDRLAIRHRNALDALPPLKKSAGKRGRELLLDLEACVRLSRHLAAPGEGLRLPSDYEESSPEGLAVDVQERLAACDAEWARLLLAVVKKAQRTGTEQVAALEAAQAEEQRALAACRNAAYALEMALIGLRGALHSHVPEVLTELRKRGPYKKRAAQRAPDPAPQPEAPALATAASPARASALPPAPPSAAPARPAS